MTKLLLTCVDKRRSVIRGAFACAVIIKYRRSSANQSQPARYVNGSLCAGINKGCVLNLRSPAKIAESQRTSVETAGVHTDRVTMNKSWYEYMYMSFQSILILWTTRYPVHKSLPKTAPHASKQTSADRPMSYCMLHGLMS